MNAFVSTITMYSTDMKSGHWIRQTGERSICLKHGAEREFCRYHALSQRQSWS